MEMSGKQFKRWLRERDAMIEKQDVQEFKRFYQKWSAFGIYDAPMPADNIIEASLRQMALAAKNVSSETKLAAALWLLSRGFNLPEGERENELKHKQAGAEGEREAPGAEDGEGADVLEAGT